MVSGLGRSVAMAVAAWMLAATLAAGQSGQPQGPESFAATEFVETGTVTVGGHEVPYRFRALPVSSFPELPAAVAAVLDARKCMIPQTYQARRPENVIHASLERPGSTDWAVLCSTHGQVALLVFFASRAASEPATLAESSQLVCLQPHDLTGVLGFNWGIDPASPSQMHDAQAGMAHRPAAADHDGLAESRIDHGTVYHFYRNGAWENVNVE